MLELSEIKKDLQAKDDLVKALQSEACQLQYVTETLFVSTTSWFGSFSLNMCAELRMRNTLRRSPVSKRSWLRHIPNYRSCRNIWTRSCRSSRSQTRR